MVIMRHQERLIKELEHHKLWTVVWYRTNGNRTIVRFANPVDAQRYADRFGALVIKPNPDKGKS